MDDRQKQEQYELWKNQKQTEMQNERNKLPTGIRKYLDGDNADIFSRQLYTHLCRGGKPSEFIEKNMSEIFGGWIRPDFKDDLLWAADNVTSWQYSTSYWRRSYRSGNYAAYYGLLRNILQRFASLSVYSGSIAQIITGDLPELEKMHHDSGSYSCTPYEEILAAELDKGNERVLKAVGDIIFGEGTTLKTDLIRGIIKSRSAEAHDMLGRLLLAARLQEGVRQAVCENADCGTVEGFMHILKVVDENDLIRFSSVKRAAGTWCGLIACDSSDLERISGKTVSLMRECLEDVSAREKYLASEDAMQLYLALWAYSFEDAVKGVEVCRSVMKNGSHHQRLVCGIFSESLDSKAFENECGKFAVENFHDEPDTMAVFLERFMPGVSAELDNVRRKMLPPQYAKTEPSDSRVYPELDKYFSDGQEARKYYGILDEMRSLFPKKEISFSPCVFPWITAKLTKSAIVLRMAWIAAALRDNALIDEVCPLIGEISLSRDDALAVLTAFPQTEVQRNTAVAAVADREGYTQKTAFAIVKRIGLSDENYTQLENMLRYKSPDIRRDVISLLMGLDDERLYAACERLLSDKSGEKRTAGLDIVMQLKKDKNRSGLFVRAKTAVSEMKTDVSKEQILIDEIMGGADKLPEGYGLYDKKKAWTPAIDKAFVEECDSLFSEVFPEGCFGKKSVGDKLKAALSRNEEPDYVAVLKKLDKLIGEHKDDEVTLYNGEKGLLGDRNYLHTYDGKFPLEELWNSFYENEIGSPVTLFRAYVHKKAYDSADKKIHSVRYKAATSKTAARLMGERITEETPIDYSGIVNAVLSHLWGKQMNSETVLACRIAAAAAVWLIALPRKEFIIDLAGDRTESQNAYVKESDRNFRPVYLDPQISVLVQSLYASRNDEYFEKIFPIRTAFSDKSDNKLFNVRYDGYSYGHSFSFVSIYELIRACAMGIIDDNEMYRRMFECSELGEVLRVLSNSIKFVRERDKLVAVRHAWWRYGSNGAGEKLTGKKDDKDYSDTDLAVLAKAREAYEKVIEIVLKTELNRGDSETQFSRYIGKIERIYGAENYVRILAAMGKDSFVRGYMYGSACSKNECLSHLISVCVPDDGDDADVLRKLVKKTDITEKRLIEAAMYSPEWLDIMEEYLGWEGFRMGCYYFMAHMNEHFDDKRKAVIAKYTPLSAEDLQAGAFDVNWFWQAHDKLGDKRFGILYDAAKYISDGAKHSRARKYADAVMGKLDAAETEKTIEDKRNKDLLMAYSLIPFDSDDELMRRYLFLQKFLKESKKFGAQRRASEASAVNVGLQNLAITAGYSDVTRLKLKMETKLFESIKPMFERHEIGDTAVWLEVKDGRTELRCEKGGKMLKSVPAKLKKDEYVLSLSETKKQLTEQYRRTKLMLEQSMEDRTVFTLGEINALQTNPVAKALTKDLVYSADGKCLLIRNGALCSADGEVYSSDGGCEIMIAHPIDMYKDGTWRKYQKYLFENQIVQPFRQVFRELYIKTDEELECSETRRYAGNQIQVKKTIACLKSRRWVCDVEDGLQKVYFRENIAVKLYALADWFSPSDIEAPTLEWVGFSDRITGRPIRIKDVPEVIFSEIMRDADMAVSVCHAGEVDPEHSHSTVEMRAAILEFTLPLFKLKNCEIKGSHVLIKGSLAEYSVHLGSGVCHVRGGAMLNILPVHSQHRGRIFLPFADDDPKTAEVISKVLLLAEDKKIKDPYILDQIHRS